MMVEVKRRRPRRETPDFLLRLDENERLHLDAQASRQRVDNTTYLRVVIALVENGTLKLPWEAFNGLR